MAVTAEPGMGRRGATTLRVAAQHPGRSCALKQFEGTGNPPVVHHRLNPNLQSLKKQKKDVYTSVNVCVHIGTVLKHQVCTLHSVLR